MTHVFDKPSQLIAFDREMTESSSDIREKLASRIGVDKCYHEGVQWLSDVFADGPLQRDAIVGRRRTNWNPDSNQLRATVNYVTTFIQKVSASTFVDKLEVDGQCPPRRYDSTAQRNAQMAEDVASAFIDYSGMVNVARDAQYRRCVNGTQGIGLRYRSEPRTITVGGREEQTVDHSLEAYDFEPTRLILDPHIQNTDLRRHDSVGCVDVWTVHKIRREFGDEALNGVDEQELKTVGDLMPAHMELNRLSDGRLYADYARYSKTKGAVVKQWHIKDETGRHSRMYVMLCLPRDRDPVCINWENPESPFGGCGLPFVILSAHRRTDVMWAMSDATMLKDDQDKANLLETLKFRMLRKGAGTSQWLVDVNSMEGKQSEDYSHDFTNAVGGMLRYRSRDRNNPVNAPQMVQHPPIPSFVQDMVDSEKEEMRFRVHRALINEGATKSHVPDASFKRAIEESNQVVGIRVIEDLSRYQEFISMGCGTVIKLAKKMSPSILSMLKDNGFSDEDFAAVMEMDDYGSGYQLQVRESSVRYVSTERKLQNIDSASQLQQISPIDARIAKAKYDTPLTPSDANMVRFAQSLAMDLIAGKDVGEPVSYGAYNEVVIQECREALTDRAVRADPSIQRRLVEFIQAQTMVVMQEQAMMAQAQAGGQQQPQPTTGGGQEAGSEDDAQQAALADIVSALSSGGGGGNVVAQPTAA